MALDTGQVSVANLVIAVEQVLDALVDGPQQLGQIDAGHNRQYRRIGQHFAERKPPSQSNVQQCNRPVGGVHRTHDVEVNRHAKPLLRVGEGEPKFMFGPKSLVGFEQRNQVAKHAGDVGAVHLVDEQVVRRGFL